MQNTIVLLPGAKVTAVSQTHRLSADQSFTLSNVENGDEQHVILDFHRCESGFPVFEIESAAGTRNEVPFQVTYSETRAGIDHEKGDGPFFLFSNAMDSYRSCLYKAKTGHHCQTIESRHAQYSQRYMKLSLIQPKTSITFKSAGLRQIRDRFPIKAQFQCADETLNRVWIDGVRTLDMCTVRRGETKPAWDITSKGTRVLPGHWAPCRKGTSWTNKVITFEVTIEQGGASWGVHMVANGLIFCLDSETRTMTAFEGLSNQRSMLPVVRRGTWDLPYGLSISGWVCLKTVAQGGSVTVFIEGQQVAELTDVRIKSILAGDGINVGSVALGGPEDWISTYRNLRVTDSDGYELYNNAMTTTEADRVFADFQVGTNNIACTIDGAKRDRACFGGDVYVMGRSLAYSTADFEAWSGSIRLLASHQTRDGYLGNLCPIQAPEHEEGEPPIYAFYSLTYALQLAVSVRDYWMHSGDEDLRKRYLPQLDKLIHFANSFTNDDGLLEAPPHLQMTWFPMGGPVIGVSAGLNTAYYEALKGMADLSLSDEDQSWYVLRAASLKKALVSKLWNDESGTLCMGSSLPQNGFSQDVNAHALTNGLVPLQSQIVNKLALPSGRLPPAFHNLGHWDKAGIVSPYASGFAAEALFSTNHGSAALDLIRAVWGAMSDPQDCNYSGAHWEAMRLDGSPFMHDVSLAHGWSTWPVFLLPRYLAGLHPRAPGWGEIGIEPALARISTVQCSLEIPAGQIWISITLSEDFSKAEIQVSVPPQIKATIKLPEDWELRGSEKIVGSGSPMTRLCQKL